MIRWLARMVGLPVCDFCGVIAWRGIEHAFAHGWRSCTWHTADGIAVFCPQCRSEVR